MNLGSVSANELVERCITSGTPEEWNEFVRRFQRPIALTVMRIARTWGITSPAHIEDLVQEVLLKLCVDDCRLLRNFVAREPDCIIGYLKIVAANVTRDHLRSEKTQKRGGGLLIVTDDLETVEARMRNSHEKSDVEGAIQLREIEDALRSIIPTVITERDRTIFWLYFRQGFSARDIGEIKSLGLTLKGVESSIHRTTRELRARLGKIPPPEAREKGFQGGIPLNKGRA